MKSSPLKYEELDLRGTPCPINFVRCRLALEALPIGKSLKVDLDRGEPERMVISGLKEAGYDVEILIKQTSWLSLLVASGGT